MPKANGEEIGNSTKDLSEKRILNICIPHGCIFLLKEGRYVAFPTYEFEVHRSGPMRELSMEEFKIEEQIYRITLLLARE